ncbi:MAG: o-succinylbenzoate synthase [Terracidiphilus sp.]|jgi:O-succinylbenzoate synthase
MKIEKIVLREIPMKLKQPFETSFGITHHRRIVLVELIADGISGWGEVTATEGPYYNSETTDTAWHVICDFLAPALVGKCFDSAKSLATVMTSVRGHEMAKAALENAAWDAEARYRNISLQALLGGTQQSLPSGVSLGIYENADALLDRIALELIAGYRRIKLKIKPGRDVCIVRAVRNAFPNVALTVDANSAYTLEDLPTLKQLDEFGLDYIEQPLSWNEIYQHAELQRQLHTPICLDECIHSLRDAQAAVEMRACGVINIKLGRVSGHTEARKIEEYSRQKGIPVWCGGMLEAGIGRAHNIAMSSLPGFVMPGDVSASSRYWDEDIIEPEVTVTPQGTITVPQGPGIGFQVKRELIERLTVRSREFLFAS